MNRYGIMSVNALRKALPFDGLLYLAIFGSQVKGTERPDSDLDVLFVVRAPEMSCYLDVRRAITETPGGVGKATIIPHIPETLMRNANVYGSVEYNVLRECGAETLYMSEDFNVSLWPGIDYAYCARRWLEYAEAYIFPKDDYPTPNQLCRGIDCLLRASLMSIRVRFPYTRDLGVLYGMLPPDMRPSLDLDTLGTVAKYKCDEYPLPQTDAQALEDMAKNAYGFVAAGIK